MRFGKVRVVPEGITLLCIINRAITLTLENKSENPWEIEGKALNRPQA
jgi:hypothetical protein